jgi:hypothetical protein
MQYGIKSTRRTLSLLHRSKPNGRVSLYISAVREKIVVLSELQKEGYLYNGKSFLAAARRAYAAHGKGRYQNSRLFFQYIVEKAREDKIEVVNAVKISLEG